MSTGQLAAFAVLVGIYRTASVLVGFWPRGATITGKAER